MSSPPGDAIVIENLVKRFRKRPVARDHTTLKTEVVNFLRGRRRKRTVGWIEALNGIDLRVRRGTTIGIIGRNGSGKSTLLKVMTGIYRPTSGAVRVHGRISALLELGAGFHPEFTGRENILINGVILGMSRAEATERMPSIIEFSELGDFVDQPVRTYSSGMYMRLAFSVATHVDPDVLIVDEILAVGDDHFARKSLGKMMEFKQKGRTIVLVTHDRGSVQRWCDVAAWIDGGKIRLLGNPVEVANEYQRAVLEAEATASGHSMHLPPDGESAPAPAPRAEQPRSPEANRRGTRQVEITSASVSRRGEECHAFDPEDPLEVRLEYAVRAPVEHPVVFGIALHAADGLRVYGTDTEVERVPVPHPLPPRGSIALEIHRLGFLQGEYDLEVSVHDKIGTTFDWIRPARRLTIGSSFGDGGIARPPHRWLVQDPQSAPAAHEVQRPAARG